MCCRVHLQPPTYLPTMGGTLNQTDVQPTAADQPKPVCRACNGTIVLLTTVINATVCCAQKRCGNSKSNSKLLTAVHDREAGDTTGNTEC